jgi:hypothetical protein
MNKDIPLALPIVALFASTLACGTSDGGVENLSAVGSDAGTTPDGTAAPDGNVTPDSSVPPECTQDIDCNDDNPCTDDKCLPAGTCERTANSAPCDDGNPCTENDICADTTCTSGSNICPCVDSADCAAFEDDDLCNGTLICGSTKECTVDPGTVVACPTTQDTACSTNTCDALSGTCAMVHQPDGAACSDGDGCTSDESCQGGDCRGVESCCTDNMDNDGDQLTDCDDPDCSPLAECNTQCPDLEPVDESPLPVESAGNLTTSTTANGHNDDYVYNQAGDRKLGIRRDWGGSIVFFGIDNGSQGINSTNTIDGNDTGREVQVALYDHDRWYQGCAYNASCRTVPTACDHTMTFFGWNPVQGGNRCNHGSGFEDVTHQNGAISLTTIPMYWNPNWDRTDCQESCNNPATDTRPSDVELTQRVRFVRGDVVELGYQVTNLGDLDHADAAHEFPTVYASFGKDGTPDLYRLFDSTGGEITTGWSVDAHGFRHQNFTSPGGWAALLNHNGDYGVALYYETGMGSFQAWNKIDEPTKFNNFRGLFSFPIGPHAEVRARSYLILGSLASMGAQAQWLDDNLPPFGSLDGPTPDANVSGTVNVHGWAMDNKSVSQVQLIIDGGAPTSLSYGNNRPDVCKVWPGYSACAHNNVGYQGSFNAGALAPNACGHVIEIKVIDNQGNEKIIARRRFHTA